ncbi:MAG: AAA domain-containing protein, partial [Myxococcota bacterium]|nr:AAA domain-containing protein [Myxococcota bacterium]
PALARFHGAAHHAHVAAFADLDRATLALVRSRAMVRLAERVPRVSGEPGGELGTLMHELKKQRGHRPLRALFAEIPTLLPRLAPCMLMSPLSVAQYLDPAVSRFDIVVFDEASQLPTADAIGALARGHAAVIVGDSKQLPPTRFFATQATDADDQVCDLESVLDDCVAARLPELRLAWHYRSRHEDLIAFANQRSYGDRLQVFPAAQASPDLGIAWRKIDGIYDRGGTRQNRAEAEAIVSEVVSRLRDPAQRARSIAVVTFSRAQQELVEDLLDEARAAEPALEPHFDHDPAKAAMEPVIVKNLEAMQGDERDVVLLSVGYGPDATGTLAMNFGPLSQRGGERRLNVAITRAREQLVVFSSFDPADIADDAPAPVRELAALLAFAKAGGGAGRAAEDTAPASRITAAIARALVERGWIVRHQVGCGAYKVDLAVVDPNDPEHYILAIEHDGSAYASAPVARDRDRLRAQILAQLGWRLHRIWSLDWWADPEREIQRAHGAIVAALAASRQRRAPLPVAKARIGRGSAPIATPVLRIPPKPAAPEAIALDTTTGATPAFTASTDTLPALAAGSAPIRLARGAIPIGPYTVAAIPAGRRAPDDLFAPRYLPELGKVVEQVLAAEAPMHVELVSRSPAAAGGATRSTWSGGWTRIPPASLPSASPATVPPPAVTSTRYRSPSSPPPCASSSSAPSASARPSSSATPRASSGSRGSPIASSSASPSASSSRPSAR